MCSSTHVGADTSVGKTNRMHTGGSDVLDLINEPASKGADFGVGIVIETITDGKEHVTSGVNISVKNRWKWLLTCTQPRCRTWPSRTLWRTGLQTGTAPWKRG